MPIKSVEYSNVERMHIKQGYLIRMRYLDHLQTNKIAQQVFMFKITGIIPPNILVQNFSENFLVLQFIIKKSCTKARGLIQAIALKYTVKGIHPSDTSSNLLRCNSGMCFKKEEHKFKIHCLPTVPMYNFSEFFQWNFEFKSSP